MEDKAINEIELKVDNKGLEFNTNHQLEDLWLHHDPSVDMKTNVSFAHNLVILPKIILRRTPFEQSAPQRRETD